jgi:microcystin-dependent protein
MSKMSGSLRRIAGLGRGRIRLVAEIVGGVLLLSAGAAVASVATSSAASPATIHGCVNSRTGALSVELKSGARCPRGTKTLTWNNTTAFGSKTNTAKVPTGEGGATCTLGEVLLMGGSTLGANMIPADGQLLSISKDTALWSLYGTRYGGNGTSTFAVPNLKTAGPNGLTYAICVAGVFP